MDGRFCRRLAVAVLAALSWLHATPALAQQWLEMRSANFAVTSSAGQSQTATLLWQLEQIRSVIGTIFAWAKVDGDRPIAVIVVPDERGMRALAPHYWEQKGGVRPASVWVTAPDQHYFAIRADVRTEDRDTINPHMTAYDSYVSLILRQSVPRELPLWFTDGFAGVLSNTIVRDDFVLLGPPIPWHLQRLRERSRLSVAELMKVTRSSPEYTNDERRYRFDAQSWALVHFLMFGDKGARREKLDQFSALVSSGTQPDVAAREAFGSLEELERDFLTYIGRNLFSYARINVDASVKREGFPSRPLSASQAAATVALFHVAMNRPAEANAAIAEARKSSPPAADSFLAEAMLLDRDGKSAEARSAFEKAVEGGSVNGYASYRLATLRWQRDADRDTLAAIEKLLLRAVSLNVRNAAANAFLAEVRSVLGLGEPLPFARRAIGLAPSNPSYRLTAARVLLRQQKYDEALKEAQTALSLSDTEAERQEAQTLLSAIDRAKSVK